MTNLWPDDVADGSGAAPVAILRHQASKLSERTKNLVEAHVELVPGYADNYVYREDFYWVLQSLMFPRRFLYTFYIVVPNLGHYRERLFYSFYGPDPYPAGFFVPAGMRNDYVHQFDRFRLGKGYKHPGAEPLFAGQDPTYVRFAKEHLSRQLELEPVFVARDNKEFVTILGAILQAPETKKLVRDLVSQVSDLGSATSDLWE